MPTPVPPKRRERDPASLVLDLARPYRISLGVVVSAMVVETLAGLATPWPLKFILDSALGDRTPPQWVSGLVGGAVATPMTLAATAGAGVVVIAVVGGVASYIDSYYTESVGQLLANDLRLRLYDHLERLSFNYFDTHQTAALLSTATDDVSSVQDFVSSSTLSMLIDLMTIVGMLVLMFWLNWDFTLVVLAVTPLMLLFVARFRQAVKKATREVRRRESEVLSVLQTGLESIRTVQAFGAQDIEATRLSEAGQATVKAALSARRLKAILAPALDVIVAGCTAFILWRGAGLVLLGAMTIGGLTVFLAYLRQFFKPVRELAKMTTSLAQANVGLERIRAILDVDSDIKERPDARDPHSFHGTIAFEHVEFGYGTNAPILQDVSFAIGAGQFAAIVGMTGSGKSTAVSLIPRFYDPARGRILIDGTDIQEFTISGVRKQIGFVLQDTVLFHGTVRENIAYGRHDATDAQIVAAARLANAEEFIARMPDGYGTTIGERGLTLSGGQRQRLGIARAFIRNAPILILDEPTAALDDKSELAVMEGLQRLMQGRTVVMITHRLHTIREADSIIVLHGGVVAEQGTHDNLLAKGGIYAELHRINSSVPGEQRPQPSQVLRPAVV
jgi:ABC-type multidrug transport system fused ATPase/permease subunit